MVLLTKLLLGKNRWPASRPGPHRYWKRRRILSMAGHFYGRRRRCYSIAIKGVNRSFLHSRNANKLRQLMYKRTWETRIQAACMELETTFPSMRKTLNEIGIGLDRKILQSLAVWEPRTFRALAFFTRAKTEVQGLNSLNPPPPGIITRGML